MLIICSKLKVRRHRTRKVGLSKEDNKATKTRKMPRHSNRWILYQGYLWRRTKKNFNWFRTSDQANCNISG
jgi:hypothetical protein